MTLEEHIKALTDEEHIESLTAAIETYDKEYPDVDLMARTVSEGDVRVSTLLKSEWQKPWATRADYVRERCIFDVETNEYLEYYIDEMAKAKTIPPILVYCETDHHPTLIDGVHRASAYLIAEKPFIPAWIVR